MTSQLGVWSLGGMWFGDGCKKSLRNAQLRSPRQGVEVQKGAQGSGFRVGICLGPQTWIQIIFRGYTCDICPVPLLSFHDISFGGLGNVSSLWHPFTILFRLPLPIHFTDCRTLSPTP